MLTYICLCPIYCIVWANVEKRMETLRESLYKRLYSLPARFEDQKQLIRYLYSLDIQGRSDPALDCLVNMKSWYSTILCSSVQHRTVQYSVCTVQYSTVYNTMFCVVSMVRLSTVQ